MKKNIKKLYALNSEGILCKASETNKSNNDFFCINCNGKMRLRKGNKRVHHFYHVDLECNNESYLHKISKTLLFNYIKEKSTENINLNIGLQKNDFGVPYECSYDSFGPVKLIDINDKIHSIIIENLLDDKQKEIKLEDILKKFFKKIKVTENNEIINIFVYFNKWLAKSIQCYINKELEYNKENTISRWLEIENKKSLIENLLFVDKLNNSNNHAIKNKKSIDDNLLFTLDFINARRYRFEEFYDDKIGIFNYFNKLTEKDKNVILKYCYIPKYAYKREEEYKDININFDSIKQIYLDDKKYKGFLADVLTIDESDIPIFWEIAVSHKCELNKINSNIKIIEIVIEDNEDVELLSNLDFTNLKINTYNF